MVCYMVCYMNKNTHQILLYGLSPSIHFMYTPYISFVLLILKSAPQIFTHLRGWQNFIRRPRQRVKIWAFGSCFFWFHMAWDLYNVGPPSDVSQFLKPINNSYKYNKPQLLELCSPTQLSRGPHIVDYDRLWPQHGISWNLPKF